MILANTDSIADLMTDRLLIDGVDQRASVLDFLDDLQKNSVDFYAQLRSITQQHRAAELRRSAATRPETSLYSDPGSVGTGTM
jgi:phospholipid-binding lipoprotein MlaA